jgi:branched-subunit amino acid aminotransferase/4-amino-4-deoxychorismate lyase
VIWVRGEIVGDDSLRVSVLDRTFEHGMGLFETFRTWNGHPTLLERHRQRMWNSARELRLPLEADQLPDPRAVRQLIDANRDHLPPGEDVRLRVTLSGGIVTEAAARSVVWMTAGPLPAPIRGPGAVISRSILVASDDPLARHKTLNYWRKRLAHDEAVSQGDDEALSITADGTVHEATRSNIFVAQGPHLRTPDAAGPLLPGVMRAIVLQQALRLGLVVDTSPLSLDLPSGITEAFLTNSLRGVVPIARLLGKDLSCPGPLTERLRSVIVPWLESGGDA